jgi:integrase
MLIDAVPETDRPIWALAFWAGLRRGEIRALRWSSVDLDAGMLNVEATWDDRVGPVPPKSHAGRRRVPLIAPLKKLLVEHRLRTSGDELVFGQGGSPFDPEGLHRRARAACSAREIPFASLHGARHTFATTAIESGMHLKTLSVLLGHSSIATTGDIYAHVLERGEDDARALLEARLQDVGTSES